MSAIEERTIDGHLWTVQKFTGRISLSLFRRLMALAADPLSEALQRSIGKVKEDDALSILTLLDMMGGALGVAGKIASRLSDSELQDLSEKLLTQTQCDHGPVNFDLIFQGEILMLLRVLAFVVEVNFIGPFVNSLGPAVGSVLSSLIKKVATVTTESTPEVSSETSSSP